MYVHLIFGNFECQDNLWYFRIILNNLGYFKGIEGFLDFLGNSG